MISPVVYWRNRKKSFLFLNKIGKLVSFTQIKNAPKGFGKHAYWVGIVEFGKGERKIGQLILEGKKPTIGRKIIGVVRKIKETNEQEVINYGVKFKLI